MLKVISQKLSASCLLQHQKSIVSLSARSFRSELALEILYPQSKQTIFTPPNVSCTISISKFSPFITDLIFDQPSPAAEKFNGFIPLDQITVSYDRSSGPGGQNVNKVNTKVDLRFHVKSATWISDAVKEKLAENVSSRDSNDFSSLGSVFSSRTKLTAKDFLSSRAMSHVISRWT